MHDPPKVVRDNSADTIAAIATAPGSAAVAIVRLSGSRALEIATRICTRPVPPRVAAIREFRDPHGELIDRGIVLVFPGPRSYTGEDVVELHGHGGAVVVDWLLDTCCRLGARQAQPGEFTMRAFLNDKLDLTQAEAVADLVGSASRLAAQAAQRSLDGRFSEAVGDLRRQLVDARMHIEAHLDFPDEDISAETLAVLDVHLGRLSSGLQTLLADARHGAALTDGITVVIAGPPNAGKSSLLNRLAGYDSAIVTDVPGTTRDVLRERLVIDGLPIQIIDTAGLRDSDDPVEGEGVRRARSEVQRADHVMWVLDAREFDSEALSVARTMLDGIPDWSLVLNKVDLVVDPPGEVSGSAPATVRVSALTGAGIDSLIALLKTTAGWSDSVGGTFSARRRHLTALARADVRVIAARHQLGQALELAAEELRVCQAALGELTGEFTSDDLLGEIFSRFCIGK